MKITHKPGYFRSIEDQLAMDRLVEHLKATRVVKPNPIKPEGMSQEDFILSLQAPSMKQTMLRDPKDDDAHIARLVGPMPEGWKANPDAKTMDESVGMRHLDPEEISHVESIRRQPKNSQGQSELLSVSPQRKESAIEAYIFTPPAKVTKEEVAAKAVNLVQYKSEPLQEVWVKMTWYQALIHKLKGNKIKQEIENNVSRK